MINYSCVRRGNYNCKHETEIDCQYHSILGPRFSLSTYIDDDKERYFKWFEKKLICSPSLKTTIDNAAKTYIKYGYITLYGEIDTKGSYLDVIRDAIVVKIRELLGESKQSTDKELY